MKILLQLASRPLQGRDSNPKDYPYAQELCDTLRRLGHNLIQIGGSHEKKYCEVFHENIKFAELQKLLEGADLFISIDSFLQHFAACYGKKGIVIFGISDPKYFGYPTNINLYKDKKYFRDNQFDIWEHSVNNNEAFVSPDKVIESLKQFNKI